MIYTNSSEMILSIHLHLEIHQDQNYFDCSVCWTLLIFSLDQDVKKAHWGNYYNFYQANLYSW